MTIEHTVGRSPEPPLQGDVAALERVADDVWTLTRPQSFLGLQLGTRMTVVRLSDGSLFVHSPVALDQGLQRELDMLGRVRHIVAPNLWHHLYAGAFAVAYPDARLHGAQGLKKKRKDLRFDSLLDDAPVPAWSSDLSQVRVGGTMFDETVFFHRRSRILIVSDLVENHTCSTHWPTRAFLRLTGVYARVGVPRQYRLAYRNKSLARAGLDRVLDWDLACILPCHGAPITTRANAALRDSFAWL